MYSSVGFKRSFFFGAALLAAALFFGDSAALAQEKQGSSPWAILKLGKAKAPSLDKTLQSYREASEKGQIGATWKLGRMYAAGDGVERDDYEAYKYFSAVVSQKVEAGSREETFVGDAYAELGRYAATGIPGTPIAPDPDLAQDYYTRAAAYHSAVGQFELGRWYLQQPEPSPGNLTLAAMWLKAAARKGHQGARAMLGNMLFQQGRVVEGLAQMTVALERAPDSDRDWIRPLQEEAFAVTDDSARQAAIERADSLLSQK